MPTIRLSVRELVEFLLRTGSIDSRFTGFDRANEGARIHRRLRRRRVKLRRRGVPHGRADDGGNRVHHRGPCRRHFYR